MFKNVAAKFIVFAFDATTNVPKTGDAANITAYVSKDYGTVTVLGDTSATEMDATNAPGYYLFDAAQAETNADVLLVSGKSATANIKVIGAPAAIFTRPTTGWLAPTTAGRTLVVDANGLADANMVKAGPTGSGTAITARDIGLSVLLSTGTGTGQLDFTSGVVKANLAQILATAITETAGGRITAAFKKFFDIASSTLTTAGIDQTGDSYARVGAPAGASVSADIAAVKVDTAAVKVQTDKLAFTVANQVDANVLDWKSATAPAMTGDAFARIGANGVSLSAIPDEAGVTTLLSRIPGTVQPQTGDSYARIGAAGVSLSAIPDEAGVTTLLSRLSAVRAGYLDNLSAGAVALASSISTAIQVADALLSRDIGSGTGAGSLDERTVRSALRFLRNKWGVSGGTLTVTEEDDTTTAWTAAVTQTAGNPVSAIDPT